MIGPAGERWFTDQDLVTLPPWPHAGIVYSTHTDDVVRHQLADAGNSDGAGPGRLVEEAMRLAVTGKASAIAMVSGGRTAGSTDLALPFSRHLRDVRARRGLLGTWITAADRPETDERVVVRVPHLVARFSNGVVTDSVVWEVLDAAAARRWLTDAVPEASFEEQLPALLRLRRAAREHRLPATPAGAALGILLAQRYLSILLVYRHPRLFAELLADPAMTDSEST